jgi:hypothetical protein
MMIRCTLRLSILKILSIGNIKHLGFRTTNGKHAVIRAKTEMLFVLLINSILGTKMNIAEDF